MGMQAKVKRQLALLIGGKYTAMVRAAGQVMPQSKELKNSKTWGLRQPRAEEEDMRGLPRRGGINLRENPYYPLM